MIDKDDIKYILCEIEDNNSIFTINEQGGETIVSMVTENQSSFHSQDKDIIESLLRLNDMGVEVLANIRDGMWREKTVKWHPDLIEWCYSIRVPHYKRNPRSRRHYGF